MDENPQISRDYNLNPSHKLQYLHKLLNGDAKSLYLDIVEGYASRSQQAVYMLENEYNSCVRQSRVKTLSNPSEFILTSRKAWSYLQRSIRYTNQPSNCAGHSLPHTKRMLTKSSCFAM